MKVRSDLKDSNLKMHANWREIKKIHTVSLHLVCKTQANRATRVQSTFGGPRTPRLRLVVRLNSMSFITSMSHF